MIQNTDEIIDGSSLLNFRARSSPAIPSTTPRRVEKRSRGLPGIFRTVMEAVPAAMSTQTLSLLAESLLPSKPLKLLSRLAPSSNKTQTMMVFSALLLAVLILSLLLPRRHSSIMSRALSVSLCLLLLSSTTLLESMILDSSTHPSTLAQSPIPALIALRDSGASL